MTPTDPTARATLHLKQIEETRIMQKVNAVQRIGFSEKYPGQVEHCLRLVMERLQLGLDKRDGVDPANPNTWKLSSQEILDLATGAKLLNDIRSGF